MESKKLQMIRLIPGGGQQIQSSPRIPVVEDLTTPGCLVGSKTDDWGVERKVSVPYSHWATAWAGSIPATAAKIARNWTGVHPLSAQELEGLL